MGPRCPPSACSEDVEKKNTLGRLDSSGAERAVGVLNWFAIHPTDRGQLNTLVCGDSKGHASALFEAFMANDAAQVPIFTNFSAHADGECRGQDQIRG